MASLLPSFCGMPNWVSCRAAKSSKLILSRRENQINHQFRRTETETKTNWIAGESMLSVTRTTRRDLHVVGAMSGASVKQSERIPTTSTEVEESIKASTFRFRTEFGDLVHVSVGRKNGQYVVFIEVSSLQLSTNGGKLVLSWGIFRSDSSHLVPSDSEKPTPAGIIQATESSFVETSTGRFSLSLVFEAKLMPFYLSFLLKTSGDSKRNDFEIRNHMSKKFCVPVGFQRGQPFPLGVSFSGDGSMNFSIFSRSAEGVVLCLYSNDSKPETPDLELDLDPYVNRSGDVWHASFASAWNFINYGYRFKGSSKNVILDPYSKITWKSSSKNHPNAPKYLGRLLKEQPFDWDRVISPKLPIEELVVYRLNVTRFTAHKSSQLSRDIAGTFSGVKEKLQHFKNLGVNAILFEPVFLFNDQKGPYFPHNFFSAMNLYGPSGGPGSAISSAKEMVKELHANGIEALLEVVFTHTADEALHGIDDSSYYFKDQTVDDLSFKAGNALNCNFPVVQQMILDSLRYWVTEFCIDGFCFINASSLLRGSNGESLSRPPLVEAIAFDPVLSKTKIIADFWDPHEEIAKETPRFPHWKRWAEINTEFCKDIRDFLRGKGQISELATRLCGSGDVFSSGRGPAFSFNFIATNHGLPLVDLVSFSSGEELDAELSWNCGEEGPTNKADVLERRVRQIRNFLFLLYVSLGVPVLSMGDECGQSSAGSIAAADRKPLDWNALKTGFGIQTTSFISFLSTFRSRRSDLFQRSEFWREENIEWYGSDRSPPKWEDPSSKFLAMSLKPDEEHSEISGSRGGLFFVFNANDQPEDATLPAPEEGFVWHRLVDTALPYPEFFSGDGEPVMEQSEEGLIAYNVKANSCALFEAISC